MRFRPVLALAALLAAGLSVSLTAQHAAHTGHHSRVSPQETIETNVADCHIAITYSRPSKKQRVIWGNSLLDVTADRVVWGNLQDLNLAPTARSWSNLETANGDLR